MPPAVSAKGYNPITAEDLTAAAPGLLGFLSSLGIVGNSSFIPVTLSATGTEIQAFFNVIF